MKTKKELTTEEIMRMQNPTLKFMFIATIVIAVILAARMVQAVSTLNMLAADSGLTESAQRWFQDTAFDLFGDVGYIAVCIVSSVMFFFTLKDHTPFTRRTSNCLIIIAAVMMVTAVFSPLAAREFSSSVIGTNFYIVKSGNEIFASSLLFIISAFFRYGTKLQQESDETL
ncbi:hypothetical protein [Ruminococcus sp.]|uniref:hypothetical protein n=1 Tax=Ruminococcus sp. TaxID=41978 RepID=UPI0025E9E5D4|nr:hypothetical protein [Ruminococcus sp.]MBQ8965715.1 hypothetical protein [Ruminococcus sp.]MBQ8968103.1 hypothetical protein [Ruminococcus sp.]